MNGVPGYRGRLVSASVLSAHLGGDPDHAPTAVIRRRAIVSALDRVDALGPASVPRHVLELVATPLLAALDLDVLHDVFGAHGLLTASASSSTPRLRGTGTCVGVIVSPWGEPLDRYWRTAVVEARRRNAAWSLLCNGVALRVIDARRLYSRRFAEFDLALVRDQPASAAAISRVLTAAALLADPSDTQSLAALVTRSDAYAATVCRSLQTGVLAASEQVLAALIAGQRGPERNAIDDSFEQSLTIVYRILFLLFAEARGLVPLWHRVYRDSYSVESLRLASEKPGSTRGLWDALRAISRLAHAGCRAGDLTVTPFNGRLFSPSRTPLAERRGLDDGAARRAILALTTKAAGDRGGRERIAYAELGVEQLGSVYETLLDYRPEANFERRPPAPAPKVALVAGAGIRKSTGTFYTPRSIAEYVVGRTLGPLVRDAAAEQILRLRVLDPAMGSGAFLVAACRYLAAAYEEALVAGGGCHASDIGEPDRIAIRRLIAERCVYGVDVNPMAVQLARLSLWLATLAAGRPLSFLDHRLVCGDSLLGAWIASLRRRPARRRGRKPSELLPLFPADGAADAMRSAVPARFSLEAIPNDTIEQVRAKERTLEWLESRGHALSQWKRIANLWCAAWFPDGPPARAYESLVDHLLSRTGALPAHTADTFCAAAEAVAAGRRFLHWELEFPEAFFDEKGNRVPRPGFDAIIGNPPWDMMRADPAPAGGPAARTPIAPLVRFTRDSGLYDAQSDGHPNRYQLFVERVVWLTRSGGRLGLVLPSGFASDAGSAALRRRLFATCDVDTIVAMDNRRRIFPIHRSMRFLLLTATAGAPTSRISCRFGAADVDDLPAPDGAADSSSIPVSCGLLERISGPTLAIPDIRHRADLAILEKAAGLFHPIASAMGWEARFGRELNATEDRTAMRAHRRGLLVVDGRHISPFRVALEESRRSIAAADARRLLGGDCFARPRLAYRDVASPTNRLTLIAALLPAGCVSTHTVFCLRTLPPAADQHLLCGLFNSLVVNYLVRLRVSVHVTTAIVQQLPMPTRDVAPRACREIAAMARRLARHEDEELLARLNATVARLYQLTRDEFAHVLDTFPLVESSLRRRALELFGAVSDSL